MSLMGNSLMLSINCFNSLEKFVTIPSTTALYGGTFPRMQELGALHDGLSCGSSSLQFGERGMETNWRIRHGGRQVSNKYRMLGSRLFLKLGTVVHGNFWKSSPFPFAFLDINVATMWRLAWKALPINQTSIKYSFTLSHHFFGGD